MHISRYLKRVKKVTVKNGYIPRFEGYSRYFTDIAHAYFDYVMLCDYHGICLSLFSPTVTKTFDANCIKLRIYDPN